MNEDKPNAEDLGVETDDLNNMTIVVVGLVSTALVLASALGVKALYDTYVAIDSARDTKVVASTPADETLRQQDAALGSARKIPGQTGVYSMPINDAMKQVVEELSAEQKKE